MKLGYFGAACAALAMTLATSASAQMKHGDHDMAGHGKKIMIQEPWARASVGKNGAAYVTVVNASGADDRLVDASADVAERVELHTHMMDGNVMKMRKVDDIPVAAGQTVTLKPGGYHIMMMGLTRKLEEGAQFPLTLTFEKAGKMTVTAHVKKAGAMGPGSSHGHGGMKH